MSNKRLKIDNLQNLQEVTTEEFSSIQGGLSIVHPIDDWNPEPIHPPIHPPKPIKPPIPLPCYPKPIPYPLPIDCHPKPIKYPIHIGWCPIML